MTANIVPYYLWDSTLVTFPIKCLNEIPNPFFLEICFDCLRSCESFLVCERYFLVAGKNGAFSYAD